MLWVRNYDDLLESWQRQPSLSLSCIKKTKQNNNKKFNDILSQDYKYDNDKKIIVKNEDQSDLMLNVFTIWCTWISEPVVYFL